MVVFFIEVEVFLLNEFIFFCLDILFINKIGSKGFLL